MTQEATTPQEVAQPSIDDRIAAKFGLDQPEQVEEAQPNPPQEATDEVVELDPADVEVPEEETPAVPDEEVLIHNGQEKRVSKEQARMLAQKGFDYESNMVQVKEERQRLAGIATALQAQQSLQAQILDHVAEAKAYDKQLAGYEKVDWITWANTDPNAAFAAKLQYDQLVEGKNKALNEAHRVAAQHQQAEHHVSQETLAMEQAELLKKIPEWKDEARQSAEKQALLEDLHKQFNSEEMKVLGQFLHNHKLVAILRNDFKYRQAVEAGKAKKGQLQGLPTPPKPGVRQQAPTKEMTVKAAVTDLRKARSAETKKAARTG
jgi:hypothetical protein